MSALYIALFGDNVAHMNSYTRLCSILLFGAGPGEQG